MYALRRYSTHIELQQGLKSLCQVVSIHSNSILPIFWNGTRRASVSSRDSQMWHAEMDEQQEQEAIFVSCREIDGGKVAETDEQRETRLYSF